ncbi:MAG: hypothetical protein COA74_01890 [Gammaproteobacteria bacterium]|nr:MAG: hypothetical protein COA74_01890 [Gammaproteobacteria bacterium]
MLRHIWGLFSHPEEEWERIHQLPKANFMHYLVYVMLLSLIPSVSWYIGTTQVGWTVGAGDAVKLTSDSSFQIALLFYVAMLVGIFVLGVMIHWMAKTYKSESTLAKGYAIAAFTCTPLFLVGILGLYPVIWLHMIAGLCAVSYTVYLLYSGLPIVMGISKERGFLFASAVVAVGLVMFVGLLGVTVILWGLGAAPVFID